MKDDKRVRTCYNTHYTRTNYNAGLPDEKRGCAGGGTFKFTDYTDEDARIDREILNEQKQNKKEQTK